MRPFPGEVRKITVTEKDKKGPEDEGKKIAQPASSPRSLRPLRFGCHVFLI
jgi:hypothetical protein